MEQRRLRLGDILDDYCPRERRVTNHAVVAMIEEDIKQTRCTTCDAEHAYKGARVPKRRRKDTPAALYDEVLAGMPEAERSDGGLVAPMAADSALDGEPEAEHEQESEGVEDEPGIAPHGELHTATEPPHEDAESGEENVAPPADGPVHRRLIRATLPRPEGQKDARPLPEFTVRHAPVRGNGNSHNQGQHGHSSFRGERMKMRGGGTGYGGGRFNGQGNRSSGRGGQGQGGFRGGNAGQGGKRGRGPRG